MTANQRLPRLSPSPVPVFKVSPAVPPPLATPHPVEDRRVFHPERADRPALAIDGRPARFTLNNRPQKKSRLQARFRSVASQTKAAVAFQAPRQVLVCVRRQRRKEVLFAKRQAGRRGLRKPRRTWLSSISCKR